MSAESLALHVSGELSEGQVSWVGTPKPLEDAEVLQLVAASERADHATLDVSYLSVPIRYQQRAQGRLHFIRKLGRQQFTRRDQRLAELLADRLGVAMERLTELMDGRIGFQSEEGRGSEFWIELPAADALRDAEPKSARALAQPAGERLSVHALARVLYIEDNPESADLMRHVLQDDDSVELEIASTAEQGLELARERVPQVVILDVNLPGISGLEAAQRLRAWPETRDVPLVALSAAAMPDDIERIGRAGFDRHLTKPVEIDELLRVLEELLAPKP